MDRLAGQEPRKSSARASAEPYRFAGSFWRHVSAIRLGVASQPRRQPRRRQPALAVLTWSSVSAPLTPETEGGRSRVRKESPPRIDVRERPDLLGLSIGLLGAM